MDWAGTRIPRGFAVYCARPNRKPVISSSVVRGPEPANDGEDEFLRARAMTIGRGVIDATAASFGEPDRTYFVRHFREGKNLEEIATELGLTRKAARIVADRVHERLGEAVRAAKVG